MVSGEDNMAVCWHLFETSRKIAGDELNKCGLCRPAVDTRNRCCAQLLAPVEVLPDGIRRIVRGEDKAGDLRDTLRRAAQQTPHFWVGVFEPSSTR